MNIAAKTLPPMDLNYEQLYASPTSKTVNRFP